MKLLQELTQLNEGKRGKAKTKQLIAKHKKDGDKDAKTPTINNLTAKHMAAAGNRSAVHEPKKGKLASRNRQKKDWKKDASSY